MFFQRRRLGYLAATQDLFAHAPWDEIPGFRNRMTHGYFTLEWERVYDIATKGAPPLRAEAERILAWLYPDVHHELVRCRARASNNSGT